MTYQQPPSPDTVWYVAGDREHTRIYLHNGQMRRIRISLTALAERWPGFVRIHNRYLIPLHLVTAVYPGVRVRSEVTVRSGSKAIRLPVSRAQFRTFRGVLVAAASCEVAA